MIFYEVLLLVANGGGEGGTILSVYIVFILNKLNSYP